MFRTKIKKDLKNFKKVFQVHLAVQLSILKSLEIPKNQRTLNAKAFLEKIDPSKTIKLKRLLFVKLCFL